MRLFLAQWTVPLRTVKLRDTANCGFFSQLLMLFTSVKVKKIPMGFHFIFMFQSYFLCLKYRLKFSYEH
jgi:hypothetical protein